VLYFPNLHFRFAPGEERFLDSRYSDGKSKNINLRANEGAVRGAAGTQQDLTDLYNLIRRYAESSESLIHALFPEYGPHMTRAGTSLRPSEIAGRPVSWRKDDTRLHVDVPVESAAWQAPAARVPQHRSGGTARLARGRAIRRFRGPLRAEDPWDVARPILADEDAAHHQARAQRVRPSHAATA
jgi:hypothetical protein